MKIQSLYWNKQDVVIQHPSSVVSMQRVNMLTGGIFGTSAYLIHIVVFTSFFLHEYVLNVYKTPFCRMPPKEALDIHL